MCVYAAGTGAEDGARPMTSIRAAGYSSSGRVGTSAGLKNFSSRYVSSLFKILHMHLNRHSYDTFGERTSVRDRAPRRRSKSRLPIHLRTSHGVHVNVHIFKHR